MLKVLGKLRRYWLPLLLLAAATLAGVYADLYLPTLIWRYLALAQKSRSSKGSMAKPPIP